MMWLYGGYDIATYHWTNHNFSIESILLLVWGHGIIGICGNDQETPLLNLISVGPTILGDSSLKKQYQEKKNWSLVNHVRGERGC